MKTHIFITCGALIAVGLFFLLFMRGYNYISYTLFFIAALVAVGAFAPLWLKRTVFILTAIGLVYFCFVESKIISCAGGDKEPERDYIIVLGASVRGTEPTLSLTHRLQGAEKYLNEYPEAKAVLSGGQGSDEEISEARCMYDWLTARGIDGSRLIMEDKSTSTMENLKFSRAKIDADGGDSTNVAILSSPYHLYRAKLMAETLGINPCGVPCIHGYPIYTIGMYIREAFAVTHLWVFGD